MKNFIKWLVINSWLHISVLLGGMIYMLTWEPGLDKTIGLIFFGVTLTVLVVGKFIYYKKNNL